MSHAVFTAFLLYVVGTFVLYGVIRLAVRHAIEDVDDRRSRPDRWDRSVEENEPPSGS
ncbi:MAG TPA: hypothetical protein VGP31_09270 [Planosporangium sp.]|jgi:hypothetical protein|nr:hypothetical protein [Planosporangium sp.]